jgi:hypothetical protein
MTRTGSSRPSLAAVEPRGEEVAPELVQAAVGDVLEHLVEREARGDRLAHLVERQGLAEPDVLGHDPLLLDAALDDVDHLVELERLEHVVVRAALHRVDRGLDRAEAGHDHGERARRGLADLVEQRDAAHARHLEVADDHVVVALPELGERARAVLGGADVVALHPEEIREHVADHLLVVNDEDAWSVFRRERHAAGEGTRSG